MTEKLTKKKQDLLKLYYQNDLDLCYHFYLTENFFEEDTYNKMKPLYRFINSYQNTSYKVLIVHLDSGGGSMADFYPVTNLLRKIKIPVITVNEFFVGSAATLIYLSGDLRITKPYTKFLIHQFRYPQLENVKYKKLRRLSYSDEQQMKIWEEFYMDRTKMSRREVKDLIRSEKYLEVKDQIKKGITDHLFDPTNIIKLEEIPDGKQLQISIDEYSENYDQINSREGLIKDEINCLTIHDNAIRNLWISFYLINQLLECPLKKINFVFNGISLLPGLLFGLHCTKSYMISDLSYFELELGSSIKSGFYEGQKPSDLIRDQIQKNQYNKKMIKNILIKTKLPKKMIDDILEEGKDFFISPKDALKYNLVDKLITLDD